MVSISAYQLLFSRVEAAAFADMPQANIKRSGYQVVFASDAIGDDVSFIERRVQCFQPRDESAERFQFFMTDNRRVVVSQSVRIQADPVITDQNERPGAFITHCYVFNESEFARINNDPFALIYDDESAIEGQSVGRIFVDTPHDLLESVRQQQQTVRLSVKRPAYVNQGQERQSLNNLLRLSHASASDQTLALIGDHTEVERLLESLITLTDRRRRTSLSFDTLVDGCNPAQGLYFAVGTSRRIANAKFVNVDLNKPRLQVDAADPKATGYTNWLISSLEGTDPLDVVMTRAQQVQTVNIAFEEGQLLGDGLDEVAVKEFIRINQSLILERFHEALGNEFSEDITTLLYDDLRAGQTPFSRVDIVNVATTRQFAEPALRQTLAVAAYQCLTAQSPAKIAKEDLERIAALGQETDHLPLQAIAVIHNLAHANFLSGLPLIGGRKKLEEQRDALVNGLLRDKALLQVLADLNGFAWSQPAHYVTAGSAKPLIDYVMRAQALETDDLVAFIQAVIACGAGAALGPLAQWLPRLSKRESSKLQKAIANSKAPVNQAFAQAIDTQLENA